MLPLKPHTPQHKTLTDHLSIPPILAATTHHHQNNNKTKAPKFSIVKIQPSYFDGFKAEAAPGNDDGSNRRLWEESMVDLLLVRLLRRFAF